MVNCIELIKGARIEISCRQYLCVIVRDTVHAAQNSEHFASYSTTMVSYKSRILKGDDETISFSLRLGEANCPLPCFVGSREV